jgi:predicted AlkP superfamily pyrophosphatase or phosphodiesterase
VVEADRAPGGRQLSLTEVRLTATLEARPARRAARCITRAILMVLLLALPRAGSAQAPADHVVLVSIDGFRPDFYLDSRWPAPRLQQMVIEGAHAAAVRGVFPTLTFASHTTLVTGVRPARHGILFNTPFEPAGATGRWYWEADSIRAQTLWGAVRQAGGTSAAVCWPVSVDAPIDYNLPEVWSLRGGPSRVETMRLHAQPRGLMEEVEREATGRMPADAFGNADRSTADRVAAIGAYLIERYKPTLLTVHLIPTDAAQHSEGRNGPSVALAVAAVDRAVSRLAEAAARAGIVERTAFVITGDHGFVDTHTQLRPNHWLVGAGLLEARGDRGRWRATFHSGGGSTFLYLRDPSDAAAVSEVRRILDAKPEGIRRLLRIVEREELDRIGASPDAALALAAVPGVAFSGSTEPPAMLGASGGAHGYFPDLPDIHTGFVAWGAGVRRGARAQLIAMEDIAPFVASLLGIPFAATAQPALPGFMAGR